MAREQTGGAGLGHDQRTPPAHLEPAADARTPTPSCTHLVLIPSYNPGPMVYETVVQALRHWLPVWVVVDGSQDGTADGLLGMMKEHRGLSVIVLPHNRGKGAAVLAGLRAAREQGYTHALCLDSDGQHPTQLIPDFMQASKAHPEAMVLGVPVFDSKAPRARVYWRRLSNACVGLETMGRHIGDSLFGFRVYPIEPLYQVMAGRRSMRRFDFDPEAAVRLLWQGVPTINIPAPVRYFSKREGGVSHFRYARDNLLLTGMHLRLLAGLLWRLPRLIRRNRA